MLSRKLLVGLIPALIGGWLSATPAWAWGEKGHIIVARIAELNLTPQAKEAIQELLDTQKISDSSVAMFADRYKHTPAGAHTASWHFVNIPFEATNYDPSVCSNSNCVVDRIEKFRGDLVDSTASLSQRRLALKFLVHFLGDIHQPLHCSERLLNMGGNQRDRGGNAVPVSFLGHGDNHLNLHSVWDENLVEASLGGLDLVDFAQRLNAEITPEQRKSWKGGNAKDWAMESHQAAVKYAYGKKQEIQAKDPPVNLDQGYVDDSEPVIKEQLRKAGIRLANVLNEALKGN